MPNDKPFSIIPLKEQSLFQKLFRKRPKENALIEFNNLLSKTKTLTDISIENIENIALLYKVKFFKKFKNFILIKIFSD